MVDDMTYQRDHAGARRPSDRFAHALAATVLMAMLAAAAPAALYAAECPAKKEPRIPPSEEPAINIDKHKKQLKAYQAGNYNADIELVMDDARRHVESRAESVKWPAVVLDVDETSLSNWQNIEANNFGFIKGGPCFLERDLACGFDDWILMASAPAIEPTLRFFKAVRDRNVAVFFITGRRDNQRQATMSNLDRQQFRGWAGLATRPDTDHGSIVPFKSGEREKIAKKGYTIVANIGDQQSDLVDKDGKDDKLVECGFKLPNPFYFID
jgi:predicted secreted acid phosphatase